MEFEFIIKSYSNKENSKHLETNHKLKKSTIFLNKIQSRVAWI